MIDNCTSFTNRTNLTVRVVFEEDGTPLFCAADIAKLAGYKAPGKVVRESADHAPSVKRQVNWCNGKKNGVATAHFYTAENARAFIQLKPVRNEAIRWFLESVIPEAESQGRDRAAQRLKDLTSKPEPTVDRSPAKAPVQSQPIGSSVADRLDAIIYECVLLKRELSRAR